MNDLELHQKIRQLTRKVNELTERVNELEHNNISFDKKLYTVSEVAKMLGLTREAVYHMIKRGELPTIKLGTIKIRETDLLRIVNGSVDNNL